MAVAGAPRSDDLRAKRSQIIRRDLVQKPILTGRDQLPFEDGAAHRTGAVGHRRRLKPPFPELAKALRLFDAPLLTLLFVRGRTALHDRAPGIDRLLTGARQG